MAPVRSPWWRCNRRLGNDLNLKLLLDSCCGSFGSNGSQALEPFDDSFDHGQNYVGIWKSKS